VFWVVGHERDAQQIPFGCVGYARQSGDSGGGVPRPCLDDPRFPAVRIRAVIDVGWGGAAAE
jgi:hypothetical protein